MEENESLQGKELDKDLSFQAKIEEAIQTAILQDKETISLEDGRTVINLSVIKEKEDSNIYNIRLGNQHLVTATKTKNGIKFANYKMSLSKLQERFNKDRLRIIMQGKQRENLRIQKEVEDGTPFHEITRDTQGQQKALQMEIDQKLKTGRATRMDIDREVSTTENMRMFVSRAWGIDAQEIYRVQGESPSDFKYVAKTSNSSEPYKVIDVSHRREGTNSRQQVYLMNNGKLEKKTVESVLIKGEYAILTDRNFGNDNTRTYLASITPSGEYIAIAAGQKQGVNRNTSGNDIQKDFMSRANSVYELEDIVDAALLAEQIYGITKDGKLTTKEVEMVRRLKIEENMEDKEIKNVVDSIMLLKKMGYDCNQIKEIIDDVKDAPDSPEAAKKLANNVKEQERAPENRDDDSDEEQKTMHDGHDGERILGKKYP